MKKQPKRLLSSFAIISVALFIIVGALYIASDLSYDLADKINGGVSHSFRRILASVTSIFDFSALEIFIIFLPLILFFVIRRAIKCFESREGRVRFVTNLAAFVLLIYTGHILALGIAHNTTPLDRKMGLCEVEVTEQRLANNLIMLRDEINELSGVVTRDENAVFTSGYSSREISEKICLSYDEIARSYGLPEGYTSSAKWVKNGWAMSYLGITGIYSYITGEANVNSYYPDYVTIFTAAHEMCHQRGILRENEANFVAYLITSESSDPALRYSGVMNMYSYFASALYKTNRELYLEIHASLSDYARADIRYANSVSDKYGDTIIEDISDWINDFYLESSGNEGIISYSKVVHLVLAYNEKKCN